MSLFLKLLLFRSPDSFLIQKHLAPIKAFCTALAYGAEEEMAEVSNGFYYQLRFIALSTYWFNLCVVFLKGC